MLTRLRTEGQGFTAKGSLNMTLISLFSLNFYKSFHDYTLLLRAPLDGYRRSKTQKSELCHFSQQIYVIKFCRRRICWSSNVFDTFNGMSFFHQQMAPYPVLLAANLFSWQTQLGLTLFYPGGGALWPPYRESVCRCRMVRAT